MNAQKARWDARGMLPPALRNDPQHKPTWNQRHIYYEAGLYGLSAASTGAQKATGQDRPKMAECSARGPEVAGLESEAQMWLFHGDPHGT